MRSLLNYFSFSSFIILYIIILKNIGLKISSKDTEHVSMEPATVIQNGQERPAKSKRRKVCLTPRLSDFEILNVATLIIQNWPVSRVFQNIFYILNFDEEYK